jgi:hypothetical protein
MTYMSIGPRSRYSTAEAYCELMRDAGNECELIGYPGQQHAFFHRPGYYEQTVLAMDAFLVVRNLQTLFRSRCLMKNDHICQDGLGTNVRKLNVD